DPKASLLNREYLVRIGYVSILIAGATMAVFYLARSWGWPTDEAQTMAVTMLALGQAAYLFNARSLRESSIRRDMLTGNPVVWVSIGAMLALQLVFVYAPFMNSWFDSAPLPVEGWVLPLVLSVVIFLLVEAGKALFRRVVPPQRVATT
ncbi:MAG TPA: cation transporting ATPase C-terminal domain-containing protein, partial [Candidatus Limnocylindrales bacterium]|nr:cation transporting ATPase C-terminal domain-containing protein [Candidatus Limnocylindrales bacterium]